MSIRHGLIIVLILLPAPGAIGEDNLNYQYDLESQATGDGERWKCRLQTFVPVTAPVQATVLPIADRHVEYAAKVLQRLKQAELRAEMDDSSERMNNKVRKAQNQKIPYMLVVGDKEAEQGLVALRLRSGENPGPISIEAFLERFKQEVEAGA